MTPDALDLEAPLKSSNHDSSLDERTDIKKIYANSSAIFNQLKTVYISPISMLKISLDNARSSLLKQTPALRITDPYSWISGLPKDESKSSIKTFKQLQNINTYLQNTAQDFEPNTVFAKDYFPKVNASLPYFEWNDSFDKRAALSDYLGKNICIFFMQPQHNLDILTLLSKLSNNQNNNINILMIGEKSQCLWLTQELNALRDQHKIEYENEDKNENKNKNENEDKNEQESQHKSQHKYQDENMLNIEIIEDKYGVIAERFETNYAIESGLKAVFKAGQPCFFSANSQGLLLEIMAKIDPQKIYELITGYN